MVKQMMDFPKPHSTTTTTTFFDSDSEEDDFVRVGRGRMSSGSSLSPSFATWNPSFNDHGSSTEVCKNRNGGYERTLIAAINRIIEENEKSILHAVEVASARVTQLDSRTRRLENSMDDLKFCVEYNQGITGGKLRELENSLKEVHMDVKFLLDKQEIAETELRLLKLNGYRTEQEPKIHNLDVQTTLPQQQTCIPSGKSYQPVPSFHTSSQPVTLLPTSAYAHLPHLNFSPPQDQVVPATSQLLLEYVSQASELSSPSPHESYRSTLVHHQALSAPEVLTRPQYTPNCQHFEPYPNSLSHIQQDQSSLHSFRVSDRFSNSVDTNFLPQYSSSSGFLDSSQALPIALPKALFLDTQSGASGDLNKASNEDIVEEVTSMGFRRDMVIAAVRKMTEKKEEVDLNTLLDKLMN